jgi:hypothetical protein
MHADMYNCFLAHTYMRVLMLVLVVIVPWLAGCIRCLYVINALHCQTAFNMGGISYKYGAA